MTVATIHNFLLHGKRGDKRESFRYLRPVVSSCDVDESRVGVLDLVRDVDHEKMPPN